MTRQFVQIRSWLSRFYGGEKWKNTIWTGQVSRCADASAGRDNYRLGRLISRVDRLKESLYDGTFKEDKAITV